MNVNDQTRPTPHPSIETALLGDEAVLYDERSGMVHHLNPPACAIWTLLDGRSVGELVDVLSRSTGVPVAELGPEVRRAIENLAAAGLLDG